MNPDKQNPVKTGYRTREANRIETAYHEAAHAVAAFHLGIRFTAVHLAEDDGSITLNDGTIKTDAAGTMESDDPYGKYNRPINDEDLLILLLAGLVATKRFRPRTTYRRLVSEGATRDWLQAREFVKINDSKRRCLSSGKTESANMSDELADFSVWLRIPKARLFVKHHWSEIERVARALLASPSRYLAARDVRLIIRSGSTRVASAAAAGGRGIGICGKDRAS